MAILSTIGAALTFASSLGLGSSDPKKDAERMARIDQLERQSIQGDADAWALLQCRAGIPTERGRQLGFVQASENCKTSGGSDKAKAYAAAAVVRVKASQTAVVGGLALIREGEKAAPGTTKTVVTQVAKEHVPDWAWTVGALVLIAGGAWLVLRK